MFFSKFIVPVVAFLGAASSVLASPIAQPPISTELTKRGAAGIVDQCQHTYDACQPIFAQITAVVAADVHADVGIAASIDALAAVFVEAEAALAVFVGVDVSAYVAAIVEIEVKLFVGLFTALTSCGCMTSGLWAQVAAIIKAHLALLAKINSGICSQLGVGLPAFIQAFIQVKLGVLATIFGYVQLCLL